MTGAEVEEAEAVLVQLEEDLIIKKIGETQYLYVKLSNYKPLCENKNAPKFINRIKVDVKNFRKASPEVLFNVENELKIYEGAPDWAKPKIYKNIMLLKLTKGLSGKNLCFFLEELGKQYPQYKMSMPTLYNIRSKYSKEGLRGIIPQYGHAKNKTCVDDDMFEDFKAVYLNSQKFSASKCMRILENNPKYQERQIPSHNTFLRRLRKECGKEEIVILRMRQIVLPDLPEYFQPIPIKEEIKKEKTFDKYIDAVEYYLNSKAFISQKKSIIASQKGYFKNHLNPFFKDYSFEQITQEKINQFQEQKFKEGFNSGSICRHLGALNILVKKHSSLENGIKYNANEFLKAVDFQILNDNEIQAIIEKYSKKYPYLYFILGLGISQAEILALEHKDIDLKKMEIKIYKIWYQNASQNYRNTNQIRVIHLPKSVASQYSKGDTGRIFKMSAEEMDEQISKMSELTRFNYLKYQDLKAVYVKLMIEKNAPITIIAKNMGYYNLGDFIKKYEKLIPQKLPKSFDPLC